MSVFDKLVAGPTAQAEMAAHDTLMTEVLAAVDKYNRTIMSEKTKSGLTRARLRGKHIGRPLFDQRALIRGTELVREGMSLRQAAIKVGAAKTTLARFIQEKCR